MQGPHENCAIRMLPHKERCSLSDSNLTRLGYVVAKQVGFSRIRKDSTKHRAPSAVGSAQGLVPQGPGFNPDLSLTYITRLLSQPLAI
jgi:hypothetical protein